MNNFVIDTPDNFWQIRWLDKYMEGHKGFIAGGCFKNILSGERVKDIDIFSYCEHHMALMYDMKVSVAYLPKDKVLGLSKIARICDMVGKRLQLQERIGSDIAEIIMEVSGSEDVAVYIEGCHSCMSARGIKKQNAKTVTTTFRGAFDTDSTLKWHFMMQAGK